jgi:hypothetical protein
LNTIGLSHPTALRIVSANSMDGGDEDDRRLLIAGVLADHRRQLEPVQLRHAHVHQQNGNVSLQKMRERLPRRAGLDQVLPQLAQDRLIAEELTRLIVDQEDVDLVVLAHGSS